MEPPQSPVVGRKYEGENKFRYVLHLCRCRVVRVDKSALGYQMLLQMPSNVKLAVSLPAEVDIKEGDILTLYTEVLANAKSSKASK